MTSLQNNPFVQKVGTVFSNLGEKIRNAMGNNKSKVCQVLVSQTGEYQNKLDQYEQKPPIDLSKVMNDSNSTTQEEQSKMKKLFNNFQKNTLKIVNSLRNKAILMLKNCSELTNNDKIYEEPFDNNSSDVTQLPNGQNVILIDTTLAPTSTEFSVVSSSTSVSN